MGVINLSVKRGETFDRTLTWWTTRYTTPRDLTGYSLRWQIRSAPGGAVIADLQIGSGITLVDAANGQFRLVVAAATTAGWSFLSAVHDLKATAPSGTVSYPLEGAITSTAPVTP